MVTKKRLTCADLPPEWFSGDHFYAPVRAWKQLQHVPLDWSSNDAEKSRKASEVRDRLINSDDPWKSAAAKGDLGGMSVKAFKRDKKA